jgi:hypothetical protein
MMSANGVCVCVCVRVLIVVDAYQVRLKQLFQIVDALHTIE